MDGVGQRAHHECFRKTGHADDQRVAAGDERHEHFVKHALLPDDAALHFAAQPGRGGQERLARGRGRRC